MANSVYLYGYVLRREDGHVLRRKEGRSKGSFKIEVEDESMMVVLSWVGARC